MMGDEERTIEAVTGQRVRLTADHVVGQWRIFEGTAQAAEVAYSHEHLRPLVARIARLQAALVEERAKANCWPGWSVLEGDERDAQLAEARAELVAEGLLGEGED